MRQIGPPILAAAVAARRPDPHPRRHANPARPGRWPRRRRPARRLRRADPGLRADPPHAARPAGVDRADLTFNARDGLTLYAQRWQPRTGEPRAAVVIHHGLADHSDRYAGFAERLVHAGYAVWAFDMRGHGRSAGVRVRIDRVDDPTRSSRWSGAASPGARSCATATARVGWPPRCTRSSAIRRSPGSCAPSCHHGESSRRPSAGSAGTVASGIVKKNVAP